ncbi:MAG: AraC family transcriptional regulator [Clostridia bacterium]|nr:AraC family transcriptional regulator [Clostridia bacterium]
MDFNPLEPISTFSLTLESYGEDAKVFSNYTHGPVITRSLLIQYCHSGSGYFEINGNRFNVRAGDCIVSFTGESRIEVVGDDAWRFSWLYFNGKSAFDFMAELNITPQNPIICGCKESRIPVIIREIFQTADAHGRLKNILLGSKLFDFFAELAYVKSHDLDVESRNTQEDYVSRTIHYMNIHYAEKDLRVDTIAKNIGLNRSYLYSIFKTKTGLSPQEYLAQLRIKAACELLKLPQATVSSVANSVGYDPLVLTRTFKKIMGINPNEYMKKAL